MVEEVFFGLLDWINFICMKFHKISRIEHILYRRISWKNHGGSYLQISAASAQKDTSVTKDDRGMTPELTNTQSFSSFSVV